MNLCTHKCHSNLSCGYIMDQISFWLCRLIVLSDKLRLANLRQGSRKVTLCDHDYLTVSHLAELDNPTLDGTSSLPVAGVISDPSHHPSLHFYGPWLAYLKKYTLSENILTWIFWRIEVCKMFEAAHTCSSISLKLSAVMQAYGN